MEGKENTKGAASTVDEEDEDVEDQTTQGGTGKGDGGNVGSDNNDGGKKDKTFTQDQVSRMMTREKKQGMNAVYKELGIDPKDTKAVAMVKALIASQKTDEQKAAEQKAADDEKAREAEERVAKAEIKAEAMVLGIKREFVEDMVALVMSKKTDDSDIKTLLGEYKKKYPTWFEDGSDDDDDGGKAGAGKKGKVGQRGTGSSIKGDNGGKKGNKAGEEQNMGQRLAARRKASAPKKSFWS